jgi:hypothetical protein
MRFFLRQLLCLPTPPAAALFLRRAPLGAANPEIDSCCWFLVSKGTPCQRPSATISRPRSPLSPFILLLSLCLSSSAHVPFDRLRWRTLSGSCALRRRRRRGFRRRPLTSNTNSRTAAAVPLCPSLLPFKGQRFMELGAPLLVPLSFGVSD